MKAVMVRSSISSGPESLQPGRRSAPSWTGTSRQPCAASIQTGRVARGTGGAACGLRAVGGVQSSGVRPITRSAVMSIRPLGWMWPNRRWCSASNVARTPRASSPSSATRTGHCWPS
jgi:hypothetical protein